MRHTKTIDIWELIEFLRTRAAPISDPVFGPGYRAAARLRDGLLLPCVTFRNPDATVDLALRRFDETRGNTDLDPSVGYRAVATSFITRGSSVSADEIAAVEPSSFAIPESVLREALSRGETSMGWTSFVGEMRDGKRFWFGTSWSADFFEMPDGYSGTDLVKVFPGQSLEGRCYCERPAFECFIENL